MFGSEILEVAIGLVFVYVMAALVCSAFREGIAKLTNVRARTLEAELKVLLKSEDLLKKLYDSQLIRPPMGRTRPKKPKQILTEDFVTALVDTLLDMDKGDPKFAGIEKSINDIENVEIRNVLLSAINGARTRIGKWGVKLDAARKSMEHWFDNSMGKLTELYKKETREVIFVVGFLLCVFLNLDTIMMVKTLYQNEALRSTVAAAAVEKSEQELRVPGGKKVTKTIITDTAKTLEKEVEDLREGLEQLGFPIGWKFGVTLAEDPRALPDDDDTLNWIYKILGILITTVAISLGAPFWFDLLRKLVSFRRQMKTTTTA
jgi:hypothetical protein